MKAYTPEQNHRIPVVLSPGKTFNRAFNETFKFAVIFHKNSLSQKKFPSSSLLSLLIKQQFFFNFKKTKYIKVQIHLFLFSFYFHKYIVSSRRPANKKRRSISFLYFYFTMININVSSLGISIYSLLLFEEKKHIKIKMKRHEKIPYQKIHKSLN